MNKIKSEDCILLIIDVQPNTLKSEKSKQITKEINKIVNFKWANKYAARWFSEEGSTFHLTRGTLFSSDEAGSTLNTIEDKLDQPTFDKQSPSAFVNKQLCEILERERSTGKNIVVDGFDIDDCVLSTVLDGHSRNLRIYALKELCGNAERSGPVDQRVLDAAELLMDRAGCLISISDIEYVNYKDGSYAR